MSGAGCRDRNLLAARNASDVRNGEIVFACVDAEATLKRLLRNDSHVALVSNNSNHE